MQKLSHAAVLGRLIAAYLLALAVPACTSNTTPVSLPPPSPTAVLPLPDSFKGYELYSWPVDGEWQFGLITGTNRTKTVEEIMAGENTVSAEGWVNICVRGLDALKGLLSRLPAHEDVVWLAQPHLAQGQSQAGPFTLPPPEIVTAVQQHCQQLELRLYVGG